MMLWPNELDPENALQLLLEVVVLSVAVLLLPVLDVAPTACVGCADWPDEPPQPASRIPKLTTTPNFLAMTWRVYSLFGSLFNLYGTIA